MDKNKHRILILIGLPVYNVWQTIAFWNFGMFDDGYGIEWFVVMYSIGEYIRLYTVSLDKKKCVATFLGCVFLMAVFRTGVNFLAGVLFGTQISDGLLVAYVSPLVVAAAVSLFLLFLQIDSKNRKLKEGVYKLASLAFGVYLFHESPFLRNWIWSRVQNEQYAFHIGQA